MPLIEPKLEIAKGNYTNHSHVYKTGRNTSISTTNETIWNQSGTYPTIGGTALVLFVSSSANQDTLTGPDKVGARTLTVTGVDGNYNEVIETITLNGTASVLSTNSYLAVNDAFVATGGSAEQSGSISITLSGSVGTPGTFLGTIDNEYKRLTQAHYTVPLGHTAYLQSIKYGISPLVDVASTAISASFLIYQKPSGSVYRCESIHNVSGNGIVSHYDSAISFDEKTEIDIRVNGDIGSDASAEFSLILVSSSNVPVQGVNFQGFVI